MVYVRSCADGSIKALLYTERSRKAAPAVDSWSFLMDRHVDFESIEVHQSVSTVTDEAQSRLDESGSAQSRRTSDVIAEHKHWIVTRWLERVKSDPELMGVSLSDAERQDHIPDLLDEVVAHTCGYPTEIERPQKAAEKHGTLRYHQGYSMPMLILEAQLLHDTIAECVQHHFTQIDLSTVLPDLTNMSDTITRELRESTRTYMRQHDWHTSRGGERRDY